MDKKRDLLCRPSCSHKKNTILLCLLTMDHAPQLIRITVYNLLLLLLLSPWCFLLIISGFDSLVWELHSSGGTSVGLHKRWCGGLQVVGVWRQHMELLVHLLRCFVDLGHWAFIWLPADPLCNSSSSPECDWASSDAAMMWSSILGSCYKRRVD